jgi:hypothetical protein
MPTFTFSWLARWRVITTGSGSSGPICDGNQAPSATALASDDTRFSASGSTPTSSPPTVRLPAANKPPATIDAVSPVRSGRRPRLRNPSRSQRT